MWQRTVHGMRHILNVSSVNLLWERFCITIRIVSVAILGVRCRLSISMSRCLPAVALSQFYCHCLLYKIEPGVPFPRVLSMQASVRCAFLPPSSILRNLTLVLTMNFQSPTLHWNTDYLVKARAWIAYCFSADKCVSMKWLCYLIWYLHFCRHDLQ